MTWKLGRIVLLVVTHIINFRSDVHKFSTKPKLKYLQRKRAASEHQNQNRVNLNIHYIYNKRQVFAFLKQLHRAIEALVIDINFIIELIYYVNHL